MGREPIAVVKSVHSRCRITMAYEYRKFYIDGRWVDPIEPKEFTAINPATETPAGVISLGSAADVDRAVAAARRAFESFAQTSREEKSALLEKILAIYKKRYQDIASAIRDEMGAPMSLARGSQAGIGIGHLAAMVEVLKTFQVEAKVVPALAAGCTMVLKPSEFSPFSAAIWAEVLHAAGVPPGVFNLINGTGPEVGAALAAHPDVDMVSFTGSTRAGTEVAKIAAATVKRVHQELGGKSPNILLDDADFDKAVRASVEHVFQNTGQSCNAPTRLLVPAERLAQVEALARKTAE